MKFEVRPDLIKKGVWKIAWLPATFFDESEQRINTSIRHSDIHITYPTNLHFAVCDDVVLCEREPTQGEKSLILNSFLKDLCPFCGKPNDPTAYVTAGNGHRAHYTCFYPLLEE